MDDLALLSIDLIYKQAINSEDLEKWKEAYLKEIIDLKSKNTQTLVPREAYIKVLDGKQVLKVKDLYRTPIYKARWVARGF